MRKSKVASTAFQKVSSYKWMVAISSLEYFLALFVAKTCLRRRLLALSACHQTVWPNSQRLVCSPKNAPQISAERRPRPGPVPSHHICGQRRYSGVRSAQRTPAHACARKTHFYWLRGNLGKNHAHDRRPRSAPHWGDKQYVSKCMYWCP